MKTTSTIYINRTFNCHINELFKWLVEPHLFIKWFGPRTLKVLNVEIDLSVGKEYRIELIKPGGQHFFITGKYLAVEVPTKLVFNFNYSGLDNAPPDSVVKISLEKIGSNQSRLSLAQEFKTVPTNMENRTRSWESMLIRLDEKVNLASGDYSIEHNW